MTQYRRSAVGLGDWVRWVRLGSKGTYPSILTVHQLGTTPSLCASCALVPCCPLHLLCDGAWVGPSRTQDPGRVSTGSILPGLKRIRGLSRCEVINGGVLKPRQVG